MVRTRFRRGATAAAVTALLGWLLLLHGCVAATDDCPKGMKDCGDVCSNLSLDSENCGGCGNKCPNGQVCNDNACDIPCGFPEDRRCDGLCVRLDGTDAHCGACYNACAPDQFCFAGECIMQ
jgi:hypothetical protein